MSVRGLSVVDLQVRSLDVDRIEVTWETSGSYADPYDFTFQMLRSESPEGPYETISETFEDRYLFIDARIPAGDKFRQLWYKVRVTHKASSTVEDVGPATQQADPDLVANYIRVSEQVLFTQVTGRRCWLFKRRTFGARCPSCWDDTTQKRTRAHCLDCYDTAYLRGYHDPIEVWVQIDPPAKSVKSNAQMIGQEVHTTGRLTFYPNVSPKDVIVEMENKRWRVEAVTLSERLRAPIKQEIADMLQITGTDIEYKLPINLDRALRDVQPSPPRMFSMPADLNSVIDERVPDIFANYETYPTNAPEE